VDDLDRRNGDLDRPGYALARGVDVHEAHEVIVPDGSRPLEERGDRVGVVLASRTVPASTRRRSETSIRDSLDTGDRALRGSCMAFRTWREREDGRVSSLGFDARVRVRPGMSIPNRRCLEAS
jgi:hypothetical protein